MASLEIVESYQAPASGPVGLAWDGRYLWSADYNSARIYCIDLATFTIVRSLINPGSLSGLAWDGRSLWQCLHNKGWLRRTNPETNDFDQTIVIDDHGWLAGVAWDGDCLWVVSQQKGVLFAVDPNDGRIVRTLPAPVAGGGLGYRDGSFWLGYAYPMRFDAAAESFEWIGEEQNYAMQQIDAANGRELARYRLDFLPMGLTWAGDDLWLAQTATGQLHRARLL